MPIKPGTLFTTGAYIDAVRLHDGSWGWVVLQFDGDTFYKGSSAPNITETADTEEKLLMSIVKERC